jgi:hypothetical protein
MCWRQARAHVLHSASRAVPLLDVLPLGRSVGEQGLSCSPLHTLLIPRPPSGQGYPSFLPCSLSSCALLSPFFLAQGSAGQPRSDDSSSSSSTRQGRAEADTAMQAHATHMHASGTSTPLHASPSLPPPSICRWLELGGWLRFGRVAAEAAAEAGGGCAQRATTSRAGTRQTRADVTLAAATIGLLR